MDGIFLYTTIPSIYTLCWLNLQQGTTESRMTKKRNVNCSEMLYIVGCNSCGCAAAAACLKWWLAVWWLSKPSSITAGWNTLLSPKSNLCVLLIVFNCEAQSAVETIGMLCSFDCWLAAVSVLQHTTKPKLLNRLH